MKDKLQLSRDNHADIGFGKASLLSGAISQDELREWLYHVVEVTDAEDIPIYIFDLLDTEDLRDMFKGSNGPVGFFLSSGLSASESDAITGVAYKRGFYDGPLHYDVHVSRDNALKALEQNPHIEERFRELFPFIKW